MRRALIVGIDDYPNAPLSGCVHDAQSLSEALSRHHDDRKNFQCELIVSSTQNVTRPGLRKKLIDLFSQPADIAFLHFSGHGTINNLDGYLVTPDYCEFDWGIPMTEILALANQSPVKDVFITLDCCHSGMFGSVPALNKERVILGDGVSVITATRSNQEALEVGGGGLFTSLLIEALNGGAAGLLGEVTSASVYAYIDNALGAWDQRPLFKANVSRFIQLRNSVPKIPLNLVHKITEYFPLPAESLQLSPEYEPSKEPHNSTKEDMFRGLIQMRYVGLVEPIGEEYMYEAAVNSKLCRLTTLGLYYWRLVNDKKI